MSIVSNDTLKTLLGLASGTSVELSALSFFHTRAEGLVRNYLKYNPEQDTHTEYYPRVEGPDIRGNVGLVWDVNLSHTRATLEATPNGISDTLQLQHLPVRSITSVNVDYNAKHGAQAGAFGANTAWVEGEDFWAENERDGLCRSGMLFANGSWPQIPGSVKVVYTAGYTAAEFSGSDPNIDASPIQSAVVLTVAKAMGTWQNAINKKATVGFGGPFQSENLQDYSYSLGASADMLSAMVRALPSEAEDMLEDYLHYGLMRL